MQAQLVAAQARRLRRRHAPAAARRVAGRQHGVRERRAFSEVVERHRHHREAGADGRVGDRDRRHHPVLDEVPRRLDAHVLAEQRGIRARRARGGKEEYDQEPVVLRARLAHARPQ